MVINMTAVIICAIICFSIVMLFYISATHPPIPKEPKKDSEERTIREIVNSMDDDQKRALYCLMGKALEEKKDKKDDEEETE